MVATGAGLAFLRILDPELARRIVLNWIRAGLGPKFDAGRFSNLQTSLSGMSLPNPIGLAAGFDKDADIPERLLELGFGYVECGTVTPKPQPGNKGKRLFRLQEDEAVINRMGFNSVGLSRFVSHLGGLDRNHGVVGANIGANKDSADPIADYVAGLCAVWDFCDYVAINISSPNTPGLRALQGRDLLQELLARVTSARDNLARSRGKKPLLLKVAPDLDETAIIRISEAAIASGISGLIVSNTTIDRPSTLKSKYRFENGGLSGKPLFEKSTRVLKSFAEASEGRLSLVGVGGVSDAATALAKIKAGASAVQLYTGWAYAGPDFLRRILTDLSDMLTAEGFATVSEAVGAEVGTRMRKQSSAA